MVEEYDVIVVGSGPGGAITAKKLAENGIKTLLIERKELPRPKICSGLVSERSKKILKPECGDIPLMLCGKPKMLKGFRVKLPDEPDFREIKDPFYNVRRSSFDFWLTMKAFDAGATILDGTSLLDFGTINEGKRELLEITTNRKSETSEENNLSKFRTKILIGADGSYSRVRKKLFSEYQPDYSLTYAEYWTGTHDLDPDYFYGFMEPRLSDFYTGFHQKDYMIVATTSRDPKNIKPLMMECYEYFEEAYGLKRGKMVFREACLTNLSSLKLYYRFGKGRVVLIGDAAGLMDFMGEGIPAALQSGLNCAETLLSIDLENPTELQDTYRKNLKKLLKSIKWNLKVTRPLYEHVL